MLCAPTVGSMSIIAIDVTHSFLTAVTPLMLALVVRVRDRASM